MRNSIAETFTGFIVLLISIGFVVFSIMQTDQGSGKGSALYGARFSNVGGLTTGTEVKLAGVKVGAVRTIALNPETYEAEVTFTVREDLTLGDATSIRVQSDALLGGSYLGLEPGEGFGEITLCEGDDRIFGESGCGEILYAQGSVDLIALAQTMFGGGNDSE